MPGPPPETALGFGKSFLSTVTPRAKVKGLTCSAAWPALHVLPADSPEVNVDEGEGWGGGGWGNVGLLTS